ncbi:MAG: hypothetical protein IH973_04790, partial [Myxococcales bacterium]|nr:hypothetical protein [Myxococcales bacterium]
MYDLGEELDSSYRVLFRGIERESIEAVTLTPIVESWFEKQDLAETRTLLPNVPLHQINAEPMKNGKSVDTFREFAKQWKDRLLITEPQELAQFDRDHPNAHQGNFPMPRRTLELLEEFHAATPEAQAEMLAGPDGDVLKADPRNDTLRSSAKDNALLALWGEAPILTQEAYDLFVGLIETLDIPDAAVPRQSLPPAGSVETHFKYEDFVSRREHSGAEAQLLLAQDEEYRKWAGLSLSDTPIPALELLVEDRDLYDQEQFLKDSLLSITDRDDPHYPNGQQGRIAALKGAEPLWVANERRVEAIRQGTFLEPTTDEIVESWVARGLKADEFGAVSPEMKVWFVDNMTTYQWGIEHGLITDEGGLLDGDWNMPAVR